MMAGKNYDIATTIKLNGEKEFDKALGDANRSMRVMDSELKKLEAAFDAGGTEMDYFTGKADALGREYKQQEAIVDALRRAVEEQSQAYGEASAEVQKYQIRLNNAEAKLSKLAKASETANRELEDLGRDSGKIGRQIENGIGDAAEDTASKLDRMFERVSADVEALKSSTTFQASMDVGNFIVEGIQGLVGFVQENDEYNRQIAIARHNVEQYGHDWDEALEMIIYAATITGNREGAYEAINNLTSTGVENQELIRAATEALLGVFLTTGGALSFESLGEDFRASVVSRTPTGTYAEVLEEILQDVVLEDVEKALQNAESIDEAYEIALSYLTKGGMQGTTKSFAEKNEEFLESQRKQQELALAWAKLADEAAPIVTGVVDLTIGVVDELTEMIGTLKTNISEWKAILADPGNTILNQDWWKTNFETKYPEFSEWLYQEPENSGQKRGVFDIREQAEKENLLKLIEFRDLPSLFDAENLEFEKVGAEAWTAYENGIETASEESMTVQKALESIIEDLTAGDESAVMAGQNMMASFANGIADGGAVVMSNVVSLVNAINQALAQISMPAIGYGYRGITGGNIYVSSEEMTRTVSRGLAQRVTTKNYLK